MSAESSKQKLSIRMNQTGTEEKRSYSNRSVPGSGPGIILGNRNTAEQIIKHAPILQVFKRVYIMITNQWFMTVFIHFAGLQSANFKMKILLTMSSLNDFRTMF